jgi:hypothetical protein
MSRLGCALAVAVLGGGGAAGGLETVLQDDALVLNRPEAQVRAATEQIAGLGADRRSSWRGEARRPAPAARIGRSGSLREADRPIVYAIVRVVERAGAPASVW